MHLLDECYLLKAQSGLTSLEIIFPEQLTGLTFRDSEHQLLGGSAMSLTSLVLDTYTFETLPSMPSLQRLVIRRFWVDQHCERLRRWLSQTPSISFLQLDEPVLPFDDVSERPGVTIADHISTDPPVLLSHLAEFQLNGGLIAISRALHVVPDPSCALALNVKERDNMDEPLYPHHGQDISDLARSVLARVTQFLSKRDDSGLASHHVYQVVHPMNDSYSILRLYPAMTIHRPTPDTSRRTTLRLVLPANAELHISTIVRICST
jgi:hypothetical protein